MNVKLCFTFFHEGSRILKTLLSQIMVHQEYNLFALECSCFTALFKVITQQCSTLYWVILGTGFKKLKLHVKISKIAKRKFFIFNYQHSTASDIIAYKPVLQT